MGCDKARLFFHGVPLVEHALHTLRSAGFEPAVAGVYGDQPQSASCVRDNFPGSGPLGGIEAALGSLGGEPALFVPVDLPLLPPAFLRMLWERAEISGALATVPFAGGRPQPLCAVYHSSLAPGISDALKRGDRKVMRVLRDLARPAGFDSLRVEALAPLHGWQGVHRWFTNLNTPGDYEWLQIAAGAA